MAKEKYEGSFVRNPWLTEEEKGLSWSRKPNGRQVEDTTTDIWDKIKDTIDTSPNKK